MKYINDTARRQDRLMDEQKVLDLLENEAFQ